MSVSYELGRFVRSFGVVVIFGIIGPLVVTACFGILVLALGRPVVELMLTVADLDSLRSWLSIAFVLLMFFSFVAAVPASVVTGLVFAVSAIYLGMNSLWTALVSAGIMASGVVILGFFVSPSEDSALILPSVQGLRQGFWLTLYLFVPAAIAASLCWLFSRPLHRMS